MRRLVSLTAAVATIAPLSMLPATGVAHASPMSVPLGGTCPDVATLNAQASTDALDVTNDVTNNGGSMYRVAQAIGATWYYGAGTFGKGVDVALIDSGVTPVDGLNSGNLIQGPDFSFESQAGWGVTPAGADHSYANADLVHNDGFGHGTHLAGIIAGRDDANGDKVGGTYAYVNGQIVYQPLTHTPYSYSDPGKFTGIAPGARVVSLKVADSMGATDPTQVIAAIDWAVKHAHTDGLNIRVINLSYGIANGSYDDATMDALSYAVDQAWKAGIVVVVAAGNGGKATLSSDPGLNSPGFNRDVITVGAYDNTTSPKPSVPTFSSGSSSSNMRLPDFSTPGAHLLSLHVKNASSDDEIVADCAESLNPPAGDANYPNGPQPWNSPLRGNDRFVKASGTSQSAAVASGAIALILSRNPELTPDQVKALLRQTADPSVIANATRRITGEGAMNLAGFYSKVPTAGTAQLQKNTPVVGGYGFDIARGFDYLWDGQSVMVEYTPGACTPGYVYYAIYCRAQPAPGSQLTGDRDIFGQPVNITALQMLEYVNKATGTYANAGNGGTGPWVSNADGTETYNGGYLRVGAKSIDGFGNPTWAPALWLHQMWDGQWLFFLDWSTGETLDVNNTVGALNIRGWKDSGLNVRGWKDGSLNVRGWKDSGLHIRGWKDDALRTRGWKDHAWKDGAWS